jgi:long-chain acyl-CoA synthetase
MNLVQEVCDSLGRSPDKVIARDEHQELTGAGTLRAARAAAGAIASATERPQVGFLLPGCALYPPLVIGAIAAGKVPVLLNPMLKGPELDFILRDAGIDTVVVTGATHAAAAGVGTATPAAAELVRGTDLAPPAPSSSTASESVTVLLYTSGTTGRPKGVPLTHENLLTNALAVIATLGARPDDVFLALLPPFHAFGLTASVLVPLLVGAEVTFTRPTPAAVFAAMAARGVTNLVAVPAVYRVLARATPPPGALRRLRIAVSGGDALPGPVRGAFRQKFGVELLEGYGLTETSPVVCVNTPEDNRPGTVGRPLPGVRVRVCGPGDAQLPPGQEGEVQVRAPSVMAGYFSRPAETAVAFTPDGWFRTGDLGRLDAEGFLTIAGRIKELIVRDGEKIMPREVEAVLERHPQVADAAVVGEPEPGRGEAVVAYIMPADPAPTEPELRTLCREHLAEFKVPRRFVITGDLPRGPTGKILKRLVKDWKPAPA